MKLADSRGFTLAELLIAIAIFGAVIVLAGSAYINNLKSSVTQQELSQMNQNLRAAMDLITRDIKLAGMDPSGDAKAGIVQADAKALEFTMDFTGGLSDGKDNDGDGVIDEGVDTLDNNGNGYFDEADEAEWFDGKTESAGEHIRYTITNDVDGNGVNDGVPSEGGAAATATIVRESYHVVPKEIQTVALNVDALNFVYLDGDGNVLATPVADPGEIRSVQVSIVARTNASRYVTSDNRSFSNQQGEEFFPLQNDGVRRTMASSEVVCRNMDVSK